MIISAKFFALLNIISLGASSHDRLPVPHNTFAAKFFRPVATSAYLSEPTKATNRLKRMISKTKQKQKHISLPTDNLLFILHFTATWQMVKATVPMSQLVRGREAGDYTLTH
uniref:Putative secreted protein n=1 Tax=Ixodes ricinus TaxID=34613 RepID=A0A6B0UJZ6_IXORI